MAVFMRLFARVLNNFLSTKTKISILETFTRSADNGSMFLSNGSDQCEYEKFQGSLFFLEEFSEFL